jgi:hypothetical protein
MNDRSDINRVLGHWLEDGPTKMPDRVVDVVADRIARQPQHRAWRLQRRLTLTPYSKLAVGLAAALIVAAVGWNLVPRQPGFGGGPTPSPTLTAAPTPAKSADPVCDNGTTGCRGRLQPGAYTSRNFQPSFGYTVPSGWANWLDFASTYSLNPPADKFSFGLYSQVAIPDQDATCTPTRKAGVGNAVADWVDFLTRHPGLVAETPVAVNVGGYAGFSIKFARADSWTRTCPNSIGPAIFVVTDSGAVPNRRLFVDDQQVTFWILDVAGETVILHVDSAPSAAVHLADLGAAQPVIDSIVFTPGT